MPNSPALTICKKMERFIVSLNNEIKQLKKSIHSANAELEKLNAAPQPDTALIKLIKKQLSKMKERLVVAQEDLRDTEEDHFQHCRPV
jgi:predicted  nucleic acid-binding Zn-ribbon protein